MSKTDGDDWGAGDWDAITEITPHLFVCGKCAINQTRLDKLGINLIINATRDLPNFVPNPAKDIRLIRVPVHDNVQESLAPYFQVRIYNQNLREIPQQMNACFLISRLYPI